MVNNQTSSIPAVKSPIRPALIIDSNTPRNYGVCLQHLLAGLSEVSCPSVLICPIDTDADSVLCPSVELIRHPMFKAPLFWVQNRKMLLSKLEKFNPTVLHCFSTRKGRLTKYLARQLDIPYVFTFNSLSRGLFGSFISESHCGAIMASSETIAEYLTGNYRNLSGRIEQINIGAFVEDTCACFSKSKQLTSMVTAQRLDNLSDYEPLLNAVRHLAIDGYEFVLAIIGKGPAERGMHEIIKVLGLSQIVTIIPNIQPMRSVFAGADIFIQPYSTNNFNTSLLEAMSTGMAVAACQGGIEDLLIEDKTAVFFDPEDELRIYASLQKLLDKHEFARKIAMAGQKHLKEHHSVSKMVDSTIQIYRNIQQWYKETALT